MQWDSALNYELLLEKSKKMNLSFSSLLGGTVLEEVARRISLSEYWENLWLKNGNILGVEQYQRNLLLHLEYDYIIQKSDSENDQITEELLLSELSAGLKENSFENVFDYGISFSFESRVVKNCLQIELLATLEHMQIPLSVKINPRHKQEIIPDAKSIFSVMFPEIIISYNSYPTEILLAEKFLEILSKLELIQNMAPYYEVYEFLDKKHINCRMVREYIEEQCQIYQIPKDQTRLLMIASYKNYGYMKKKWKTFLRFIHCREPLWEDAIERFLKFFEPIWEAVLGDFIFFGDWEPDIDRFL